MAVSARRGGKGRGTHDDKVQHVYAVKVQAARDERPQLYPNRLLQLALPRRGLCVCLWAGEDGGGLGEPTGCEHVAYALHGWRWLALHSLLYIPLILLIR